MCAECYSHPCPSGCPNYEPPTHDFKCSFCGKGMYNEDPCVIKDWDFICTDCIENLSDEKLAHLLELDWIIAVNSGSTCHLCEENIKKSQVYGFIDGKPHHKHCLADLEVEHLLELAQVESSPYD